jgi:predicted dehydrogenase
MARQHEGERDMNLAIVGCGFVADYYLNTLPLHPELKLLGAMDRDAERAETLCKSHGIARYSTLGELLEDSRVELVLNLTNPRNHYEVSKAALLAGKHVYSEKPLAMEIAQATELVELAESRGLAIASAPCSILGETAQTVWKVLREGKLGTVRVVYAEMDDGLVPLMQHNKWMSVSGVPWPSKDEFEVGCTLEHAGYYLTWLAAWFGPATTVTSFASVQFPDKLPGVALDMDSPDFSVACIQFASGVVARLTCSLLAPHDHTLKIVADGGVLYTDDSWNYRSKVYSRSMVTIRRKTFLNPLRKSYALPRTPYPKPKTTGASTMDYARGPAELAESIRAKRPCRLSPRFSLHVNEMALAIHWARRMGATYRMTTTFEPMEPMAWSQ